LLLKCQQRSAIAWQKLTRAAARRIAEAKTKILKSDENGKAYEVVEEGK